MCFDNILTNLCKYPQETTKKDRSGKPYTLDEIPLCIEGIIRSNESRPFKGKAPAAPRSISGTSTPPSSDSRPLSAVLTVDTATTRTLSTRSASPNPSISTRGSGGVPFADLVPTPIIKSAVLYPFLSDWLKQIDTSHRKRQYQFGNTALIESFHAKGWERLDDLVRPSITVQKLIDATGGALLEGHAEALLNWADEDVQNLVQRERVRMIGQATTRSEYNSSWGGEW